MGQRLSHKNSQKLDAFALKLSLMALELTEKNLGREHSDYGHRLNNLLSLYRAMSQTEKIPSLLLEATQNAYYNINRAFKFLSENEKEKYMTTMNFRFDIYQSTYSDFLQKNVSMGLNAYNLELILKGMLLNSSIQMRQTILNSGDSLTLQKYDQWVILKST